MIEEYETTLSSETSSKPNILSILLSSHKVHRYRSAFILGLFVIYLPIVYQIHLDILAAWVIIDIVGPGLWWISTGYTLFPIPFNLQWIGSATFLMLTPLSPLDEWAYYNFVPNTLLRAIWSFVWLAIGLAYVIWPLLSTTKPEEV